MSRRRRARPKSPRFRQTLGLFGVFSVLVGINVYVFFFSKRSLKSVQLESEIVPAETPTGPASRPASPVPPQPALHPTKPREGKVHDHEGLGLVLAREGLPADDIDRVLHALQPLMNFKKDIHAGQTFVLQLDDAGHLATMEFKVSPGVILAVSRSLDGGFEAVKR